MKMDDLGGKPENPLFSETSTWMSRAGKLDGIKGDRITGLKKTQGIPHLQVGEITNHVLTI